MFTFLEDLQRHGQLAHVLSVNRCNLLPSNFFFIMQYFIRDIQLFLWFLIQFLECLRKPSNSFVCCHWFFLFSFVFCFVLCSFFLLTLTHLSRSPNFHIIFSMINVFWWYSWSFVFLLKNIYNQYINIISWTLFWYHNDYIYSRQLIRKLFLDSANKYL
jgi:hypothetical protein